MGVWMYGAAVRKKTSEVAKAGNPQSAPGCFFFRTPGVLIRTSGVLFRTLTTQVRNKTPAVRKKNSPAVRKKKRGPGFEKKRAVREFFFEPCGRAAKTCCPHKKTTKM